MNLVLGVDGGGSKTHAVVADDEGNFRGFATNGPSNWETVGLRGAADSLRDATVKALAPTGKGVRDLKAAAFGLAGVDWESDFPRVNGVIDQLELGCDHVLVNDSMVALRAGTRDQHGVVLVAGTGAVAAGVNRAGETFRTLGQGMMLGDVGSASDVLGRRGARRRRRLPRARAGDQRSPSSCAAGRLPLGRRVPRTVQPRHRAAAHGRAHGAARGRGRRRGGRPHRALGRVDRSAKPRS